MSRFCPSLPFESRRPLGQELPKLGVQLAFANTILHISIIDEFGVRTIAEQIAFDDLGFWSIKPIEGPDKESMWRELPSGKSLGHAFPLQVLKFFQP